jgi:hypothetical protein
MNTTEKPFGHLNIRPWVTIRLTNATDVVLPPRETWVDTEGFVRASLLLQVLAISGCALKIETAAGMEGPWNEIDSLTAPPTLTGYSKGYYLTTEADVPAVEQFAKYIRWRIVASGGGAYVCFRLVGVFKPGSDAVRRAGLVDPGGWMPRGTGAAAGGRGQAISAARGAALARGVAVQASGAARSGPTRGTG